MGIPCSASACRSSYPYRGVPSWDRVASTTTPGRSSSSSWGRDWLSGMWHTVLCTAQYNQEVTWQWADQASGKRVRGQSSSRSAKRTESGPSLDREAEQHRSPGGRRRLEALVIAHPVPAAVPDEPVAAAHHDAGVWLAHARGRLLEHAPRGDRHVPRARAGV